MYCVMIVIEINGISNLIMVVCILLHVNAFKKGKDPCHLPTPTMGR